MSKANYKIGDVVKVAPDNDNENYKPFRDKPLKVLHVATNKNQHKGYDDTMDGQGLYDLFDIEKGQIIPFSLYDYELIKN